MERYHYIDLSLRPSPVDMESRRVSWVFAHDACHQEEGIDLRVFDAYDCNDANSAPTPASGHH